jgi:hypothetical protein
MPFDAELKQLWQDVRTTFGEEALNDARDRALVMARKNLPDDILEREDFDGDAHTYDALKIELRRLIQRH